MMSFITIGLIGFVMLLVSLIGDIEIFDGADGDGWLSLRTIGVFMAWYGACGGLLYHYGIAGYWLSAVIAIAWSTILTVLAMSLLNWCINQAGTTAPDLEIIGRKATVSAPQTRDGFTMVSLKVGPVQQEFLARSEDRVNEGDPVFIIDRNGNVCFVKSEATVAQN